LIEQLQQASYAIGQQMYAQQEAASQQATGERPPGSNGGSRPGAQAPPGAEEEVIEGEFREV
jgi:hypothetical protein